MYIKCFSKLWVYRKEYNIVTAFVKFMLPSPFNLWAYLLGLFLFFSSFIRLPCVFTYIGVCACIYGCVYVYAYLKCLLLFLKLGLNSKYVFELVKIIKNYVFN